MNKELENKAKIFFAQGENELKNARIFLVTGFDGKVRTCARRAAGFYIDGLLSVKPREHYGNSFINHLRALYMDASVPANIRKSAESLTAKISNNNLPGKEALRHAEIIINYCKTNI